MQHGNGQNGPKRLQRCTGMDRTHPNYPEDPKGEREWTEGTGRNLTTTMAHGNGPFASYDPQGAWECAESTQTNPIPLRAYGNGPNVHERKDDHQGAWEWTERSKGRLGMDRKHSTHLLVYVNGPNVHERTRRPPGRPGMDQTHPTIHREYENEREAQDIPKGAGEWTERTRTNLRTPRVAGMDRTYTNEPCDSPGRPNAPLGARYCAERTRTNWKTTRPHANGHKAPYVARECTE